MAHKDIHTDHKQSHKLERVSSLYHEMEELYHDLKEELSKNSYPGLIAIVENLQYTMNQAATLERDLLQHAVEGSKDDSALMASKYKSLQGAINANKDALKMAVDIKSLLQHELKQMVKGRTAISGYKAGTDTKKRLLNSSC